jgi:hypothetical protein
MSALLLRPLEAAHELGLSESAIYRLMASGDLPTRAVPNTRGSFIHRDDLTTFAASLTVTNQAAPTALNRRIK